MDKFIITAVVTGTIHTATISSHLPVTPDQIIDDALKPHEAPEILHLKGRDKVKF